MSEDGKETDPDDERQDDTGISDEDVALMESILEDREARADVRRKKGAEGGPPPV